MNSKKRFLDLEKFKPRLDLDYTYIDDRIVYGEFMRLRDREVKFSLSNIVVDSLEALTVIDVNKKGAYKKLNKEDSTQKVNLDSCMEIANVISLKGIGGIVVVDFINTNSRGRKDIINRLHKALKFFNLRYKLNGFTKSNLCEILIFR